MLDPEFHHCTSSGGPDDDTAGARPHATGKYQTAPFGLRRWSGAGAEPHQNALTWPLLLASLKGGGGDGECE